PWSVAKAFEWDPKKALANLEKHGVSFEVATSVFADPLAITFSDPDHSMSEARELTVGQAESRIIVIVSHTDRSGNIRKLYEAS
ncbi:MAG TPA: BrnT family toxin, partial [Fimbriimonas sp.]|nr:BrnT family toxin [Fimbriimonas sp.]